MLLRPIELCSSHCGAHERTHMNLCLIRMHWLNTGYNSIHYTLTNLLLQMTMCRHTHKTLRTFIALPVVLNGSSAGAANRVGCCPRLLLLNASNLCCGHSRTATTGSAVALLRWEQTHRPPGLLAAFGWFCPPSDPGGLGGT